MMSSPATIGRVGQAGLLLLVCACAPLAGQGAEESADAPIVDAGLPDACSGAGVYTIVGQLLAETGAPIADAAMEIRGPKGVEPCRVPRLDTDEGYECSVAGPGVVVEELPVVPMELLIDWEGASYSFIVDVDRQNNCSYDTKTFDIVLPPPLSAEVQ